MAGEYTVGLTPILRERSVIDAIRLPAAGGGRPGRNESGGDDRSDGTGAGLPAEETRETKGPRAAVAAGILTVLVATLLTHPLGVVAQDEASAYAAVEQIFEGMRTANPQLVRAVFAEDARFAMIDTRDGAARVRVQSVDGWIGAIGDSGGSWDEQIYDVEVTLDGSMASVWAPYTFYRDGSISHCGINSIEMLHDGSGWKVTQISDTRRQSDCPDPLG